MKTALGHVIGVEEDDVAPAVDAAVAVVEAVDRGVELVVGAKRLEQEVPGGASMASGGLTVKRALPVSVLNVRESCGPRGSTNPPGSATRSSKFSNPGTTCSMWRRMTR